MPPTRTVAPEAARRIVASRPRPAAPRASVATGPPIAALSCAGKIPLVPASWSVSARPDAPRLVRPARGLAAAVRLVVVAGRLPRAAGRRVAWARDWLAPATWNVVAARASAESAPPRPAVGRPASLAWRGWIAVADCAWPTRAAPFPAAFCRCAAWWARRAARAPIVAGAPAPRHPGEPPSAGWPRDAGLPKKFAPSPTIAARVGARPRPTGLSRAVARCRVASLRETAARSTPAVARANAWRAPRECRAALRARAAARSATDATRILNAARWARVRVEPIRAGRFAVSARWLRKRRAASQAPRARSPSNAAQVIAGPTVPACSPAARVARRSGRPVVAPRIAVAARASVLRGRPFVYRLAWPTEARRASRWARSATRWTRPAARKLSARKSPAERTLAPSRRSPDPRSHRVSKKTNLPGAGARHDPRWGDPMSLSAERPSG